jgi:hypothetical protein
VGEDLFKGEGERGRRYIKSHFDKEYGAVIITTV